MNKHTLALFQEIILRSECNLIFILRQELDEPLPSPHGKAIWDSFPVDWNSKLRIAGQLKEEAGPHPDHIFFILEKDDLLDYTCAERLLGGQRGVCQGMFYPDAFLVKSILAKRRVHSHGRNLRYMKYGLWTRKIKKIGQRKLGRNTQ